MFTFCLKTMIFSPTMAKHRRVYVFLALREPYVTGHVTPDLSCVWTSHFRSIRSA